MKNNSFEKFYNSDKSIRVMAMEQDVEDAITTDMISSCDHLGELMSLLDEKLADYVSGKIITEVATEFWNEYWSAKA